MKNKEINWDLLKKTAYKSGFYDDGYGDPICPDWDSLLMFSNNIEIDIKEKQKQDGFFKYMLNYFKK